MLLLLYCVKRVWGSSADKKRILEKKTEKQNTKLITPLCNLTDPVDFISSPGSQRKRVLGENVTWLAYSLALVRISVYLPLKLKGVAGLTALPV